MAKQAPNPIDIQDFQFKLHCRLKIFSGDGNNGFQKPCHVLANASRFGLVFVGTTSPAFKVIQVANIETLTQKENDEADYKCRMITVSSVPTHLSVNCDCTKLAVVVERNGCIVAVIYDVPSFLKKDVSVIQEIRLSTSPGVGAFETTWNPTLPNVFTVCKNDCTLGVYEFKETGIDINELPSESQALCMCWSPKGKQIAVGSANGKITQYKPDLKAMKVINPPPLDGAYSIVAIQWISSFQFIAIYKCTSSDAGSALFVVDAPKAGDVVYTNYEDICYSYGNTRPVQFYTFHEPLWNILVVASSNSMEVGVLGSEKEQWTQWILGDTARAELPLSSSKQETLPVGLALDKSAVEPVVWGEHTLPPAPFLFVLSHCGVLCCFKMINIKNGVQSICQAPEALHDVSGLNSFVSVANVPPKIQPIIPQQTVPNPTLPPQQIPLPQTTFSPPKQMPQPPKEVTFAHQTSLFPSTTTPSMFVNTSHSVANIMKPSNSTRSIPVSSEAPQTFLATPKVSSINTVVTSSPVASAANLIETKIDQEETDMLISKLIREECETLEKELKVLLHKGSLLKINLGSDGEPVKLVQDTDSLQNFLTEVIDTSAIQASEVHSLKQALIQTWAWYEDARSRYVQIQDPTLDTLFRSQQLDPVSQRYMADIQYLTYYLESQLAQAVRALDERWENFQDSCKKISRVKVPSVETIYQTMVRQSATHQKQKYILKDISTRIRAQRNKANGRSLLVSLNNVEQLENDLLQLQLDPSNILSAQFERVLETQMKLSTSKIKKLEKMLSEKETTHISVNKPQLSNTSLQTILNNSTQLKRAGETTVLGAALSPIGTSKSATATPKIIDFVQSTPKSAVTIPARAEKLDFDKPIKTGSEPAVNTSIPAQVNKTALDFAANMKKTFSFGPQPSPTVSESHTKPSVPPATSSFTAKTDTMFSFAAPTASPTVTTTTVTSTPQFNFGQATTSSFTTMFGTTKPSSTVKLTPPVPSTPGTEVNKLIPSTANSAFVPTTQLAFTFTAKSTPSITPSATNLTTKSPHSTFSFLSSASETQQTTTIKNLISPKTTRSNLLSESTSNSQSFLNAMNTSMTAIPSSTANTSVIITPSTTPVPSKTSDKLANLFGTATPFSFSTTNTQNSIFSFKTPSSQESQGSNPPTPTTSSYFAPAKTKTTAQTTILENLTKPAFSFPPSPPTTSSKSLFSPVLASETTTQPTIVIPSTNIKVRPSDAVVTTTTSTSSIFGSLMSTTAVTGTTSASLIFSTASTTTTAGSSIFGTPVTSASLFATSSSNIFGSKTTTVTTPTSTTATTPSIFGSKLTTATTTSSIIFGNTTITSTTPVTSIFGVNTAVTTTTDVAAATTSTTPSIFGNKTSTPATTTTSSSIFGAVPAATVLPFGLPTTTAASQAQSTNTVTTGPSITSTSQSAFGVSSATTSIFAALPTATATSGYTTASAPNTAFGQPTTTASVFSTPKPSVFGEPVKSFDTQTPSVFGAAPVFGTPAATPGSIFGSSNSSPSTFGTSGSIFGGAPTTNAGFGQTSTSSFSFSAAAANISDAGFGKPAFGFAASQQTSADGAGSFSFNGLNMGASATTPNTSFGQSQSANPFAKSSTQDQKPAFGGGSLFGTPSSTTSSIFGGGSQSVFGNSNSQTGQSFGSSSNFGSNSTFGQSPTFGQTVFGASSFGSPQQPAPFSGSGGQSVAQTGFGAFAQSQQKSPGFGGAPVFGGSPGGFGSPPAFGSTAPAFGGSTAFGSPGKVFGGDASANTGGFGATATGATPQNPTFANLANQNTIGFGALAQQSSNLQPATPFQSSSFSTWR